MHHLITATLHTAPSRKVDVVVGLDARGFLLGPLVALRLGAAFVPVRKKGKLPGECIQKDAIKPGQICIVIDDLIATGGSAFAAGELIKKLGGKTLEYLFLIELTFLEGTKKLDAPAYSIVKERD
ncbi:MAG: adenine phosphoribosyltransferase [Cyphobasidiales sp. Tagirdzhanova-0007]|nr:MAG: adenine phosphoribosyltransferase [Cyphobasidiales sp. Tagirdzhanova-0007]